MNANHYMYRKQRLSKVEGFITNTATKLFRNTGILRNMMTVDY